MAANSRVVIGGVNYYGCRVQLRHVVNAKLFTPDGRGYCVTGMRDFAKAHGFDFGGFVRDGIPLEQFIKFEDDDMVKRVIQEAKTEWVQRVV